MEYASTSFKVKAEDDQTAAIDRFKDLMIKDEKYNLFNAWNEL
jgi:deoxyhypusine synthase